MKLNLGSRDRVLDGFKNMDIDKHPGVDYVGDVSDLSRFRPGSISAIFASNILEHFPHVRTRAVLNEWHRALKNDGILYVSVPDFARAVQLYGKYGLQDWVQNFLCGDQAYTTAYHYAIFDWGRLREQLKQAGFARVSRVETFAFAPANDCSNMKSTVDNDYVCLNVVAEKA